MPRKLKQPKKPISEKQLAANRANAKLSTGPRTTAGRKTVSLNALKHGLAGNTVVLPDEDHAAHDAFCAELVAGFAPATADEQNLAQSIAHDLWRLDRARAVETNMFAVGQIEAHFEDGPDPAMQLALAGARTFMNYTGKFALLSLYEQRIHRGVHKNRAELKQMQTERKQNRQTALDQLVAERLHEEWLATSQPEAMPLNDLQPKSAENGFVYANNLFDATNDNPTLTKAA